MRIVGGLKGRGLLGFKTLSDMKTFIFKRLLQAIPVLLGILTLTFFLVHWAPGGPFEGERAMAPEVLDRLNAHYGLDQPVYVQYGQFLKKLILEGDLGPSFRYPDMNVSAIIAQTAPVSMELALWALCVAMGLGVGAGVVSALKPHSKWDTASMATVTVGVCLPTFVLGPLLILVFAIKFHIFHASGWETAGDRILPALSLGFFYAAYSARLTRTGLMEIRSQDYMRTARAKGLSELRVFVVHGLRSSLSSALNVMGPIAAAMVSGSFVTETLFNVPGMGFFYINAAFNRDYTLVIGMVLFYATAIVCFNFLVDCLQAWLNPCQKFQ